MSHSEKSTHASQKCVEQEGKYSASDYIHALQRLLSTGQSGFTPKTINGISGGDVCT